MTLPASALRRIGLVVPSSNTTMETEVPELLRRQQQGGGPRYAFHSARLRLREVRAEALRAMNEGAAEAAESLCEAGVDALMYACLVAAMVDGRASMRATRERLAACTAACTAASTAACTAASARHAVAPALVTSADALIAALQHLGAASVAMLTPYRPELAASVAATIGEHGVAVRRLVALGVTDNLAVGRLDPRDLLERARGLDLSGCDALVISACVQMPSLDVVDAAEREFGLPVLSAATASVWALLRALGETPRIAGAGSLLRGGADEARRATTEVEEALA